MPWSDLWTPLLARGRLGLLAGARATLRTFHHELAHDAVHHRPGSVLWADGEHGFNPYAFAELNLTRGHEADAGATRLLVKRCMTPFQWDTVLTKHLAAKLHDTEASLVLAAPYDALFSTDELQDWEQEDYVAFSLRYLRELARRFHVPVLLSVDMARWWRTHPTLARATYEAAEARWTVEATVDGWRATAEATGEVVGTPPLERLTLLDFLPKPIEVTVRGA